MNLKKVLHGALAAGMVLCAVDTALELAALIRRYRDGDGCMCECTGAEDGKWICCRRPCQCGGCMDQEEPGTGRCFCDGPDESDSGPDTGREDATVAPQGDTGPKKDQEEPTGGPDGTFDERPFDPCPRPCDGPDARPGDGPFGPEGSVL